MHECRLPMLPRVTIMIPTYCQEDVILDAVDSALAQDYPNLEIVVADDASPDGTAEVLASRKDKRLRYHRNPCNLGRTANYRNALYNLSNGDWVVNLDGDDYYTNPQFISQAVKIALADSATVIVSANCRVVVKGEEHQLYSRPVSKLLPGIEVLRRVYDKRYHFFHMATLYSRPKALLLDFYRSDAISSDWESLYRLALCGNVAFIDVVAGVWRVGENSASSSHDWKSLADNLAIWDKVFIANRNHRKKSFSLFVARQRVLSLFSRMYLKDIINSRESIKLLCNYLLLVKNRAGFLVFAMTILSCRLAIYLIMKFISLCFRAIKNVRLARLF